MHHQTHAIPLQDVFDNILTLNYYSDDESSACSMWSFSWISDTHEALWQNASPRHRKELQAFFRINEFCTLERTLCPLAQPFCQLHVGCVSQHLRVTVYKYKSANQNAGTWRWDVAFESFWLVPWIQSRAENISRKFCVFSRFFL